MNAQPLQAERRHLAQLLEAVQRCGFHMQASARKLAAHDYDTDYTAIAEHFNQLNALRPGMLTTAGRLLVVCAEVLNIRPASADFDAEFLGVLNELGVSR